MCLAVVPAAGASRRMGRPKLLLPFAGGTVVGATVAALQQGGAAEVVLVVAPTNRTLAAWGRGEGLRVTVNSEPSRGMLSSVQAGIAALGPALAGRVLLVCPADLPALRPATVRRLIAARREGGAPLAVPVHRGRRGHPLAVAPGLVAAIDGLDPEVGLRQLLERHREEVLAVPVADPGVLLDLDTPDDYRALTGRR